jgi:single-strand DNA-binding protein
LIFNHQKETTMKSSGLFRIGRDAETRFLPDGTAVCNVSLAFNYGKKGQDGNRPSQWIDASIFGARAETLGPMLLKGSQHVFHLSDAHIETYRKADGSEGFKMAARVDDVELTDRRDAQQAPQQRQQPQAAPRQAPPQRQAAPAPSQRPGSGFDDLDDDMIPF